MSKKHHKKGMSHTTPKLGKVWLTPEQFIELAKAFLIRPHVARDLQEIVWSIGKHKGLMRMRINSDGAVNAKDVAKLSEDPAGIKAAHVAIKGFGTRRQFVLKGMGAELRRRYPSHSKKAEATPEA